MMLKRQDKKDCKRVWSSGFGLVSLKRDNGCQAYSNTQCGWIKRSEKRRHLFSPVALLSLVSLALLSCGEMLEREENLRSKSPTRAAGDVRPEPSPTQKPTEPESPQVGPGERGEGAQKPGVGAGDTGQVSRGGEKKALVVLSGGYASCGAAGSSGKPQDNPLSDLFKPMEKRWKDKNIPSVFLSSCYSSSFNPTRFSFQEHNKEVLSGELADFSKVLQAAISREKPTDLYMIGHSYGGWTVMKLLQSLSSNVKLSGLVTLDPISRTLCTPNRFLNSVLAGLDPESPCRQSPKDFSSSELKTLRSQTRFWTNYYQKEDSFIVSGPVAEAENILMDYEGSGAHSAFVEDKDLLEEILKKIGL